MSKAENLSKQYSKFRELCGIKDPVMLNEIEEAYFEGYHQAEKDLKLGWEDMRNIYDLAYNLRFPHKKQKEFFEEVLKRFKAMKEK